ncbi:MAG: glutamate--cysteine ligase [Synechococcus sp.]
MTASLLLKGFEIELFTGRASGENVGIAAEAARSLPGFVTEPDNRNIEYITAPVADYAPLTEALLAPRRQLRQWLETRSLTLLPGSTLSLGNPDQFERSDPGNAYHSLIEATYGTRVVTASIHINLGINDTTALFTALRLIRCEAALLLALSASSPFLGGTVTGAHSQRWLQFPLTPSCVPLFHDHQHYINWVDEQLQAGAMHNVRHLWTSVRPNGPNRPHHLNRLELRICDLITDPALLLAVTTLLELRVLMALEAPDNLDPLCVSQLSPRQLQQLSDRNDAAAAQSSLDASLHHWRDGRALLCRDWIAELCTAVTPLADKLGLQQQLDPIHRVLQDGNQAMRWLAAVNAGAALPDVLQAEIHTMADQERSSAAKQTGILG